MNMQEIRAKAREQGVKARAGIKKADLIRTIQAAEGNPQCFGAEWRFDCQQMDCCWRKDCLT
jgi:hypothetical protein